MTVDTRDILLKAAEDVQSGMWCRGGWFVDSTGTEHSRAWVLWPVEAERFGEEDHVLSLDQAARMRRCAGGSILLAAAVLGRPSRDAWVAITAVSDRLGRPLEDHNDDHLPDDPFEAGQQLAELFRTTAESL